MNERPTPQEVRLSIHPGEWYMGNRYTSLFTVLGTCVALTAWHPRLKLGGLCHYLLPVMPMNLAAKRHNIDELRGRYGSTALLLMKNEMTRHAPLGEYQLGLFGGSDSLTNYSIGKQNILYAQQWLYEQKLTITHTDIGGTDSRSLIFTIATGDIKVKHARLTP